MQQMRAVHVRQMTVDQHKVELAVRSQRGGASACRPNLAIALRDCRFEKAPRYRIVVDDQHVCQRCGLGNGGRMRKAREDANALVSCRPFRGAGA